MFEEIKARLRHERIPLAGIELKPPVTGWHTLDLDERTIVNIREAVKEHFETFDFTSLSKPLPVPLENIVEVDHVEE